MRCVCVLCVSGCQPLRWCCVTAAVQPLELAAHNDTLDILMMPALVHYWRYLPPLLQPGSVLMYTHSLSAHYWPLCLHSISANTATWKCLLPQNKLMLMSTFSTAPLRKKSQGKSKNLTRELKACVIFGQTGLCMLTCNFFFSHFPC